MGHSEYEGEAVSTTLLRLAWKALIYYIWRERNGRMYRQSTETTQQVFEHIKEATCIRLAGIKGVNATQANRQLSNNWGSGCKIGKFALVFNIM